MTAKEPDLEDMTRYPQEFSDVAETSETEDDDKSEVYSLAKDTTNNNRRTSEQENQVTPERTQGTQEDPQTDERAVESSA